KAAYDIFKDAVDKMIDRSCDSETEAAVAACVTAQPDVMGIDMLKTRVFGNRIYVDIEISADGSKTLCEGHAIAEQVHAAVEQAFPKIKHIMVHVNPAGEGSNET
ncbi:MAG: cation-efflux pump, partial [Clostridia bacterium]|nr:cation-efflux pump [Clostridia bacterium]